MAFLNFSGVLVAICRTLHLSGWSCICHWSSHFCNVSRSCCRMRQSSSDLIPRFRLIIDGFMSQSRMFHLYGDVIIADGGLQSLGLCSTLKAFEQGGIFNVPHLLWHGTSVFPVSSKGSPFSRLLRHTWRYGLSILTWILTGPHSVASYDTQGMLRTYSNPDPYGVRYKRQSSVNSLVVDFTTSSHELFSSSPQRPHLLEEDRTVSG
jgi:hypothetical protein